MTTKTITPSTFRQATPRPKKLWSMPPRSTAERVERIESLGHRIDGYIQFMCQDGNPNGASADAKEKAVEAFYEQMVVLERELGRIHEDFQLE